MIQNVYMSSCKVRYSYLNLKKLDFSPQITEKYSNNKFHENPSSGSQVVPCGRLDDIWKDRHKEANSHFSLFCLHA